MNLAPEPTGSLELALAHAARLLESQPALAIEQAVRWAQPGDVVLVAGKGHEVGQEIDGVKHPFDDREVLGEMIGRFAINTAHGGKQ